MSRKRKKDEELIKTHVLNLTEIREAEAKEMHLKRKKLPILFLILGIVLIGSGCCYSKFTSFFVKKEVVAVSSKIEKNTLTCISNIDDKKNNFKIYTKTIYSFNNKRLISSDSSMSVSLLEGNDISSLTTLMQYYKNLYNNGTNGVIYNINMAKSNLYFNSIISNYSAFDLTNYNPVINSVNHTSVYEGGEMIDSVKKSEEKLGNLCN